MTSSPNLALALGWRLSKHARQACAHRGVSVRDVLAALIDCEQSYTCEDRGPGRQVRQRGPLAVVVDQHRQVVITVLLRQCEQWTDEDARAVFRATA